MEVSQQESRNARRQRVLKGGKIVFNNHGSVVDCTIRDLSATGAKLVCRDFQAVPDEFELVTMGDNQIRSAIVKWRKADMIGIDFTTEARRAPARKW